MNKLMCKETTTMSSREIADLVGSRHDKVKQSIVRLAERDVITQPPMGDESYRDGSGRKVVTSVYHICKRDSYVVVAQLSPEFTARLVDRWQELEDLSAKAAVANHSRQVARLEAPQMTEAIKIGRESAGKEIKHYHFSNEFDLVNRIALGQTASKFRAHHGLDKSEPIRDHLTACQISCIEHLQRLNTSLIEIHMDFEQRKEQLNKVYLLRHKRALMAEVLRLEA
jgi:phage regulator Rha-like protein